MSLSSGPRHTALVSLSPDPNYGEVANAPRHMPDLRHPPQLRLAAAAVRIRAKVVAATRVRVRRKGGAMSADIDFVLARPSATRTQHAVRLLVLLDQCGEPPTELDPPGMVSVVRSELRLQATDFWLRNPDYLADELITMVESGLVDDSYMAVARRLLQDAEPDLRYYPMPKWLHGAYEPLDDAFSVLETYGLATAARRGTPGQNVAQTQFFLTIAGAVATADLAREPVLGWYAKQVKLVALVAGEDVGSRLKERQYLQTTYANTELGLNIASIADRVRERLAVYVSSDGAESAG